MVKPQGGTRPIALMSMLYRIWTKVRKPYIQMWEKANAGPWDAAVEGSFAFRAALTSMFGNEFAYYKGEATLSTLYDMENLHDNISIPKLIEEATRLAYPSLVLKLGLQMHMACRSIRCYQFHPGVTTPTNGIITGCIQSTTFAQILLHAICQEAYEAEIPEALARGYN
eukprot:3069370-Karenia_brevis.AAC.1